MKRFFPLLCAVLLLAACDRPQEQLCQELEQVIEAKAEQLPRQCEEDAQCVLVQVHSNLTVAANTEPNGEELRATVERRDELCTPYPVSRTIFSASCVEGICEALPVGQRPEVDLGADVPGVTPDAQDCDCQADPDCASSEFCAEGCFCASRCEPACANVDNCGLLLEVGLGSSRENCLLRCEALLENEPRTGLALTSCLSEAACDEIRACIP